MPQPTPPDKVRVSRHAIQRARQKWLERDDQSAEEAVRTVLLKGEVKPGHRGEDSLEYRLGTRVVYVTGEVAATVILYGRSKTNWMVRGMRKGRRTE
jgi:hypothetical protein